MAYTKQFTTFYPAGWKNRKDSRTTPATAEVYQQYDDTLTHIEDYLSTIDNDSTNVEWQQHQTEGTKIATITINDTPTDVYVPNTSEEGGGGTTNYNNLTNKPQIEGTTLSGNKTLSDLGIAAASSIPTQTTVSEWGFTKNTGTVTGVKINGSTKSPSSGIVDLGTVITSHQSLDGLQSKLDTQTAYTAKGSATKVPQITTNELGQVVSITEVSIAGGGSGGGGSGASGDANFWEGTLEEFEAQKDNIKDGTLLNIKDDKESVGDINALVDAINGEASSVPILNLPYCTDIVNFDSASVQKGTPKMRFQKYGHIVIVDEIASWDDTAKNTQNAWTKVCDIPAKYRPSIVINTMGFKDGTQTPIVFNITSSVIQINGWANYGSDYFPHLHAVYYTNNEDF